MKKIIAVLLTAAMLIGICGVSLSASAFQLPKVNDKIAELNECFSNSASDGFMYVTVYYDVVPVSEDVKKTTAIERGGVDPADLSYYRDNYRNLTEDEKQFYTEQSITYMSAYWSYVSELAEQNAAPFLEQMGITLQYNDKNVPIYHNRRVVKNETNLKICLSKAEVLKAAELDYAEGIVCDRRVSKNKYRTILFKNNRNWENVYLFGYDWDHNYFNGEFPGKLVDNKITDEYGDEYYAIDIPRNTQNIILSNGSGESTYELYYLEIVWGDYYAYYIDETSGDGNGKYNLKGFDKCESTYELDEPGDGNFVLLDNMHWKEAYLYATDKDGNELYGEYPGKKAKRFLNYGGMQFQVTVPEGVASIIVSNGKGEKTEPITHFDPYYGYSLGEKNAEGDYLLEDFDGYLPEPGGEAEDEWLEPVGEPEGNQYEDAFKNWSVTKYGEEWMNNYSYTYNELYTHYNGDQPDWVLCQAKYGDFEEPMITWLRIGGIGGRTIIGTSWDMPFATGYGVYDVKANEFYALEDLTDDCFMPKHTGLSADKYEGLADALAELNIGYMTGDANGDNKVDVLDATFIQKVAGGKADIDYYKELKLDVNKDNEVDILDATAIQKYAAA